jgi:hypothetical protein
MRTAKVVIFNDDAEDLETLEWWYGEHMTALVNYFIPLWRGTVEAADSAGVISNVRGSIDDMLRERLVTVDEVHVFTPSGTELPLWLGFGHYDKDRKVVILDVYCGHEGARTLHRMCDSPNHSADWSGYLVFTLSDSRVGTLVMANSGHVVDLPPTEIAELCRLV